jgi:hypothetical protein
MNDETQKQVDAQQFAQFLKLMNRGELLCELGAELRSVNDKLSTLASQNGIATGAITVVFKIKHEAKGVVAVATDIKTKLPPPARGTAVFFATPDGGLAVNDPRQVSLPLREVAAPAAPKAVEPKDQQPAKSV